MNKEKIRELESAFNNKLNHLSSVMLYFTIN